MEKEEEYTSVKKETSSVSIKGGGVVLLVATVDLILLGVYLFKLIIGW